MNCARIESGADWATIKKPKEIKIYNPNSIEKEIYGLVMPNRSGLEASDVILEPLIAWCAPFTPGSAGRKTALARRMGEMSGRNVTRDMVRTWLHPDPKRRRQPSFAYGLLLVAVGLQLRFTNTKARNTK